MYRLTPLIPLVLLALACTPPKKAVAPTQTRSPLAPRCWATFDKSAEAVEGRRNFVERKLVEAGLIKRTYKTSDDTARVIVTPIFETLDYDDKQNFMGVVYAYHFDGCGDQILFLTDSKTNNKLGLYAKGGLRME